MDDSLINYYKRSNKALFEEFEEKMAIYDLQNYIPIYHNFFNLGLSNYNNINLNHNHHIKSIKSKIKKNIYECELVDMSGNNVGTTQIFFKYSPLIDPAKYMEGKYTLPLNDLKALPDTLEYDVNPKIKDINNGAYTDGFFSFLSSKLLTEYKIPHCVNFYGAFIGTQGLFTFDVSDDWEYMYDSTFFCKHKDELFYVDEEKIKQFYISDSRSNKPKLSIADTKVQDIKAVKWDNEVFEDVFEGSKVIKSEITEIDNIETSKDNIKLVADNNSSNGNASTSSSYSSRTSNTDSDYNSDSSCVDDADEDEDEDKDEDSCSDSDDDYIDGTIIDFPVEIISQEVCKDTLDHLMKVDEISIPVWRSILMQVIMSLLVYQKAFNFTHNDLHTNNIMYVETDKEFIYYKVDDKYYKVPTFGKIFKIIDFGRAIYKYKGKILCSDSYHPTGDAATQYNCEPYFNEKKARLEPHYGFDLCRLACALYDDLVDEDNSGAFNPLSDIIKEWCTDDNGKNILYKTNGVERYPDFKLYKMIARTVHNPTPKNQLKKEFFALYETVHKKINKKTKIVNIDTLPSFI
jgi:hypothetical protein